MIDTKKAFLRGTVITGLSMAMLSFSPGYGHTQVAGSTTIGVTQEEMKVVTTGWSAKKDILGKAIYNDKNEKIGTVDDLIVSPDRTVTFAIVSVGGFLGMGKHDVAIPVKNLKGEGKLMLSGATKEALKALPEFKYTPNNQKKG
jgi:sporulation protein YlmC with PRC-barrel domain